MMSIIRLLKSVDPRGLARRFLAADDGVMAVPMLIFFFLMLLIGGIAVDVMRFETRRVAVQNTMDRATLAAASLEQTLTPADVVGDYFQKAGLGQDLDSVEVSQGLNYRVVSAKATVISNNYFMSLMDTPYLRGINSSIAEQRVTNVEIALVLDVSGSMYNSISRITNLKIAAKEFVDTVLANDTQNKVSLTLVPYNGQVNLGSQIFGRYTASHQHGFANSYCLDLPTSTYDTPSLSRTTAFPQTPFADSWSTTTQGTGYTAKQGPTLDTTRNLYSNVWCQPIAANAVRVHTNNATTLKNQIDGLVAIGATSIDLGMKWGVAMLDPNTQPVISYMASIGQVPSYFAGRPAAYTTPTTPTDQQTLKVIVLMTDGENFEQERFNDEYRAGPASTASFRIYKISSGSTGYLSIFHASKVDSSTPTRLCNSRPYWVPHLGAWHSRPWNGTTPSSSTCYSPTASISGASIINWEDLWEEARVQWVAWQLFARALGTNSTTRTNTFNSWMAEFRTLTDTAEMDSRLKTICDTAKARGVLVYGIAFEAPTGGQTAIRNCVSQPASTYFFDVQGLQISTAFALIASNLSQLRLTQ